jgi:hypothetical protein
MQAVRSLYPAVDPMHIAIFSRGTEISSVDILYDSPARKRAITVRLTNEACLRWTVLQELPKPVFIGPQESVAASYLWLVTEVASLNDVKSAL